MGGRVQFSAQLSQRADRQQTEELREHTGIMPP